VAVVEDVVAALATPNAPTAAAAVPAAVAPRTLRRDQAVLRCDEDMETLQCGEGYGTDHGRCPHR
jgi:hypothetical protein